MLRDEKLRILLGAYVVASVDGDDFVAAVVFLGVEAGDMAHFAGAVGARWQVERALQDPGSQTEPGAPFVFLSVESMA